jgi:hypothetical protein
MKIFVSHRRNESADITHPIREHLVRAFGQNNVFRDVDWIPAGRDFRSVLSRQLDECDAVLLVIGPEAAWSRHDDPHDWVQFEVATALARELRVIPVLAGGAVMPRKDELPYSLKPLADFQCACVRPGPDFYQDLDRLIGAVRALEPGPGGPELQSSLEQPAAKILPVRAPAAATPASGHVAVHFDRLDRYHGAGALVMAAGSVGMIVSSCLGLAPLWAAFLVGALPTFLLAVLVHPEHA